MYYVGKTYQDNKTGTLYELVGDESVSSWYLFIKNTKTGEISPCSEDVFVARMKLVNEEL